MMMMHWFISFLFYFILKEFMCSLRSEGPRHFIPNTVENQKRFSLYFHKITRTTHSAALAARLTD